MFSSIVSFLQSTKVELTKLVWPSRSHAIYLIIVVLASLVIATGVLAALDFGLASLLKFVIERIS